MTQCRECNEPITFRHVEGRLTPIHLTGNFCSAGTKIFSKGRAFREPASFVNPNARCPVCNDKVYFYQSPAGGRVFFDALGWPWPKHGCTDHPASRHSDIVPLRPQKSAGVLRDDDGGILWIFELVHGSVTADRLTIRLKDVLRGVVIDLWGKKSILEKHDIHLADFREAPSFLIRRSDLQAPECGIEFISARHRAILAVIMRRA